MGSAWSCIVTTFINLVEKEEETHHHLLDETKHMSIKKVVFDTSVYFEKESPNKSYTFYNPIGKKERETRIKFAPTQSPRLKSIPEEQALDVM